MNRYKKGMMVYVKELEGSKTQNTFSLDSKTGYMKNMIGKHFPVESVGDYSIRIYSDEANRTFAFHRDDVSQYAEEPEPIIFKFNTELLDIAHEHK